MVPPIPPPARQDGGTALGGEHIQSPPNPSDALRSAQSSPRSPLAGGPVFDSVYTWPHPGPALRIRPLCRPRRVGRAARHSGAVRHFHRRGCGTSTWRTYRRRGGRFESRQDAVSKKLRLAIRLHHRRHLRAGSFFSAMLLPRFAVSDRQAYLGKAERWCAGRDGFTADAFLVHVPLMARMRTAAGLDRVSAVAWVCGPPRPQGSGVEPLRRRGWRLCHDPENRPPHGKGKIAPASRVPTPPRAL